MLICREVSEDSASELEDVLMHNDSESDVDTELLFQVWYRYYDIHNMYQMITE